LIEQLLELQEKVGKVKVGVDKSIYKRLRCEPFDPSSHKEPCCSICLNDFEESVPVIKLDCCHLFDQGCLKRWTEENKNCPVCKTEIRN